ncbi:MAG TPA: hypothetical protein VLF66_00775, partial [Thermoanaerobaculia bacterium]|nr:hypothetical protein [Thermoanaerobaculia bacterium]
MPRVPRVLVALLAAALPALPAVAAQHPNHVEGFQAERLYQLGNLDSVNLFNGNLTVQIPVGQAYGTGGDFSYQLVLTYTGNVWEYETLQNPVDGHDKLMAVPRRSSNAGLGWRLSLGDLEDGYRSPDGAAHPLGSQLHLGGSTATGYSYSTDSTYLRLNSNVSPKILEFPDGTRKYFDATNRLTQVADRFNNSLTVAYVASAWSEIVHWKLTDSQGRIHWIYFKPAPAYGSVYRQGVVDKVVVTAFNGTTTTYTFGYSATQVTRGLTDSSLSCLIASTTETVPLLTSVSQPDGTAFTFTYDPGPYHSPCAGGNLAFTDSTSAHMTQMKLPTRGSMEWSWEYYLFPKKSERVGPIYVIPPAFSGPITPFTSSAGVIER